MKMEERWRTNNRGTPYVLRQTSDAAAAAARDPAEESQRMLEDFQQEIIASSFWLPHKPLPLLDIHDLSAHTMSALMCVPFYPLKVVQTLTQLGYEPTPAQKHYNLLRGSYFYYYPGLIGYARAIVRESGWRALYRGWGYHFTVELMTSCARSLMYPIVEETVVRLGANVLPEEEDTTSTRSILIRGLKQFLIRLLSETIVTAITHPCYVMNMRTIAQQIGNENLYDGRLDIEVSYQNVGLRGLYAGFVPALLWNSINVALYSTFCILSELVTSSARPAILLALVYIGRTFAYPLFLTANMMAVNNVGLAAGIPPRVPVFSNWQHCYRHLRSTDSLHRGLCMILSRFPQAAYKEPPKPITY